MTRRLSLTVVPGFAFAAALAPVPVLADMIPVRDGREIWGRARYGVMEAGPVEAKPDPFIAWDAYFDLTAEYPPPSPPNPSGSTSAFAFQNSLFLPNGIIASGTANGQTQGDQGGSYAAYSLASFTFRVDDCHEYTMDATIDPGDPNSGGEVELFASPSNLSYVSVSAGHEQLSGRLSPGTYVLTGRSSVATSIPSMQGPTYSVVWFCVPCADPLIASHPVGGGIVPGSPFALTVVPANPSPTLTYQWRRNLVPLEASPLHGGETTETLTLFEPEAADTGYYDVVLTEADIVEASSLAHVTLGGVTAVDPRPRPDGRHGFTLGPATPNPSSSATSFRYAVERPTSLAAAIHDVSGRLVRAFPARAVSGDGALTWDGRDEAGERVAPGVYFLAVTAGGATQTRRLVRMP